MCTVYVLGLVNSTGSVFFFFISLVYVISYFWIIIRSELCLLKISRTVNCVCSCFAAVNYVFFTSEPYKKCTVYFGLSWSEGVNCVFLLVRVKCVSLFIGVNCVFLLVAVNYCVFFLVGVNCVLSCLLEWNLCPCSLELTVCSCLLEWTVCSCLLVWIMCSCLLEWTVCSCLLKLTACSCLLEWTGCAWPKNHHTKYIYFMYFYILSCWFGNTDEVNSKILICCVFLSAEPFKNCTVYVLGLDKNKCFVRSRQLKSIIRRLCTFFSYGLNCSCSLLLTKWRVLCLFTTFCKKNYHFILFDQEAYITINLLKLCVNGLPMVGYPAEILYKK